MNGNCICGNPVDHSGICLPERDVKHGVHRLTRAVDAVLEWSFEDYDKEVCDALESMRYENERMKRWLGFLPERREAPMMVQALVQALSEMIDAVQFMSGSADFGEGGLAHEGWLKVRPKLKVAMATLSTMREREK